MRSGTPSLREVKPDPMPAADRDGQPYLMAGGQGGKGAPVAYSRALRARVGAAPRAAIAAYPSPSLLPNRQPPSPNRSRTPFAQVGTSVPAGPLIGPWHEVRHAIAARGEARPHAGGRPGRSALPNGRWASGQEGGQNRVQSTEYGVQMGAGNGCGLLFGLCIVPHSAIRTPYSAAFSQMSRPTGTVSPT